MMTLPKDFRELLSIFAAHEVQYLIVGGYAVAYYGYVRATNDLDIWISTDGANAEKVVRSLIEFGFSEQDLDVETFTRNDQVIRMGMPPFRIELLTSVSGLDFSSVYSHRVAVNIEGLSVSFIDLENLKINKRTAGRHKDLDDLENL
jgi:predicted nucleotidyltransferase